MKGTLTNNEIIITTDTAESTGGAGGSHGWARIFLCEDRFKAGLVVSFCTPIVKKREVFLIFIEN
jgi:hypothetical protein